MLSVALAALPWMALAAESTPSPLPTERDPDQGFYVRLDKELERQLQAADGLARDGNWPQALTLYQQALETPSAAVVESAQHSALFESSKEIARQRLAAAQLAAPADALAEYRRSLDLKAQPIFEEACQLGDPAAFAPLLDRYAFSQYGGRAYDFCGDWFFDRGEFLGAHFLWSKLLQHRLDAGIPTAQVLLKDAAAQAGLGQLKGAEQRLSELLAAYADVRLTLAGVEASAAEHAARLRQTLAQLQPSEAGQAHWPAGQTFTAPGGVLWTEQTPFRTQPGFPVGEQEFRSRGLRVPLPHLPVIHNGTVFLQTRKSVRALSLSDGALRWRTRLVSAVSDAVAPQQWQFAPLLAGGILYVSQGSIAFALDADSGKELWRAELAWLEPPEAGPGARADRPGAAEAREESDRAAPLSVLSPPALAGSRLILADTRVRKEAEAHLVALDRASGELAWRTFLCSRSSAIFGGMGSAPAAPAIAGNTAFCATHLGAIAAVDVLTGEVRWLFTYPSLWPERKEQAALAGEGWANGPVLCAAGQVLAAPCDSEFLYALDASSGQLLWRVPRSGHRHLVGLWQSAVILSGQHVAAIDLASGRSLWRSDPVDGEPMGRPAIIGPSLFVPTGRGIFAFELRSGRLIGRSYLLPDEQPGNLLAADGQLLMCGLGQTRCLEEQQRSLAEGERATPHGRLKAEQTLFRAGAWREAVELYERAAAGAPTAEPSDGQKLAYAAARRGAEQAFAQDDAPGAVPRLQSAVKLAPDPASKAQALLALAAAQHELAHWREAVDAYQLLIADVERSEVPVGEGLALDAHTVARRALYGILEEHGPEAYQEHEKQARELLAAAEKSGRPEAFLAVAGRYPNSSVAWPAAAAAVKAILKGGDRPKAHQAARAALELLLASSSFPRYLVEAAQLFEDEGDYAFARLLLLRACRQADAVGRRRGDPPSLAARQALEHLQQKQYAPLGGASLDTLDPPLLENWRSGSRLDDAEPQIVRPLGAPPDLPAGCFLVAAKDQAFRRAARFQSLECRRIEDGTALWSLQLGPWTGQAVAYRNSLILSGFSQLVALNLRDGRPLWKATVDPRNYRDTRIDKGWPLFDSLLASAEEHRIQNLRLFEDHLFVSTAGGELFAFQAAAGKLLWLAQIEQGQPVADSLWAARRFVALCSENPARLYLFSPGGEPKQTRVFDFPGPDPRMTDSPVVSQDGGFLFAVLADRQVRAVELDTLREQWHREFDYRIDKLLLQSAAERLLVVPDRWERNAHVVALDPKSGQELWRVPIPEDALAETFTDADHLYVAPAGEKDVSVQAYGLADGQLRWQTALPDAFEVLAHESLDGLLVLAYSESPSQQCFACLDRLTGQVLDTRRVLGAYQSDFAVRNGTLCAATDAGLYGFGDASREETAIRLLDELQTPAKRAERAGRLAALCIQLGKLADAQRLLVEAIQQDDADRKLLAGLREQLAGVREERAERSQPLLVAEKVPRPLVMEGQVADAWPLHRSAILNTIDHVSPVAGTSAPPRDWEGPDDLGGSLCVAWDDQNLYLVVNVTDSVHRNHVSEARQWIGDALMVGIDPEGDGGYGLNPTGTDQLFTQALTERPPREEDRGEAPEGQYAVQRRDDDSGTVYESALPWSYLRTIDPRPGTTFGLDVAVIDDDGAGAEKLLQWTPGLELHASTMLQSRGFVPAFFGKVILLGQEGDDDE